MALYPQSSFINGGLGDRTHTNLVRSEGMSPAEKWILDPDLPGLFEYRFGGFGMVVIPKGIIVAVTAPKYDWETGKVVNCLTIANGENVPIGVAPYNFYEKKRDRMGDNQLSIINREYIEVPFVVGSDAADMKWGCATADDVTGLNAGDFVKPNGIGQFVKWTEGDDSIAQMVGQVLAVETDLPPLGWLAYFLNMDAQRNELNDAIKDGSYAPATILPYPGTADWASLVKRAFDGNNPTGIKFLTDGYFRAKVTRGTSDTPVLIGTILTGTPAAHDGITINGSSVLSVAETVIDGQILLKLAHPIAADEPIKVFFAGSEVREGQKYHVDYRTNQITLYVNAADNGKAVSIACTLVENQVPGIPTEWDYKGSVGAARILLCK